MKYFYAVLAIALLALTTVSCSGCEDGDDSNQSDVGADTATMDSSQDTATHDSSSDTATEDADDETTPSDIAGLTLHLEASQGVTSSGGTVSAWADSSGNGHDFTQDETANQPTLVASAINEMPALEFDGEAQQLDRADSLGLGDDQDRTVVVVGKLNSLESRMPFFMQGIPGTEGAASSYFGLEANTFKTTGERFGLYLVSHAYDTEASTNTDFNVHLLRTAGFPGISAMEQGSTYFLNGQELSFSQTPDNATNPEFSSTTTAIGGFPVEGAPSTVLDGQIAEVLVYNGALSDEDVGTVSNYLLNKYAIQ